MMGWWRPINTSVHLLFFFLSSPQVNIFNFIPNFQEADKGWPLSFKKNHPSFFRVWFALQGSLKLLFACVCPWADRVILFFWLKLAESHLPISLWMQFRAECHNPRCASCLQTITGLSLPTVVCTFGYKSNLKRKNGLTVKRRRDAHMFCMGALWAATWAQACKLCSCCLAVPPGKHSSSARIWPWLRKLGAISLV